MTKKFSKNFNPSQLDALSGSAAIDYYAIREEQFTGEPIKRQFLFPSDIPPFRQPGWALGESYFEDTMDIVRPLEDTMDIRRQLTPVIHFKPTTSIRSRFLELQKWEGIVLQILKDTFIARLIDLTHGGSDEEAEFSFEEVHIEDQSLIKPGAIFYWNIGYLEDRGQRIRASVTRFRRVPTWKSEEIEAAKRDAQYVRDLFDWK